MTRTPRLEYWQSPKDGQWYWHLKGANGKVVCHGEGHPTAGKAIGAARRTATLFAMVPTEHGTRTGTRNDQIQSGPKVVERKK